MFQDEIVALRRDLNLKQVELSASKDTLTKLKEENVTIRMQLLDPSAIKRDPSKPHVIRSAEEGKNPIDNETLKMFERVQKIYDVVMLQEELKQVLNENQ